MNPAPEPVRVTATAMATDGRAVARLPSGKVVFLEGALPGEEVDVEVRPGTNSWDAGRVSAVRIPAAGRVRPVCPHVAEGCGGCDWQHVGVAAQAGLKAAMVAETLHRIGRQSRIPLSPTVTLDPWRGRTTVRAAVADGRVALRQGSSHDLVPIEGCLVAHPLLLPHIARRYPGARSVILRCGARTGEVLIDVAPGRAGRDLPRLVRRDHFHEQAAGRTWRISARSFFQSRPDGADALARLVVEACGEGGGRPAVDLYSGVGLFAGVLADAGWSVTAVEGSARSADDARINLEGSRARVVQADVTRWRPTEAAVAVADPSRAGLGRDGATVMAGTGAERVVLVSCDVASLARDAYLLNGHGYELTSVTPVDLFPQTHHIEAVSVFDRARS